MTLLIDYLSVNYLSLMSHLLSYEEETYKQERNLSLKTSLSHFKIME